MHRGDGSRLLTSIFHHAFVTARKDIHKSSRGPAISMKIICEDEWLDAREFSHKLSCQLFVLCSSLPSIFLAFASLGCFWRTLGKPWFLFEPRQWRTGLPGFTTAKKSSRLQVPHSCCMFGLKARHNMQLEDP